jgi:hypothetical protein
VTDKEESNDESSGELVRNQLERMIRWQRKLFADVMKKL